MNITVRLVTNYCREYIYPVCPQAKLFTRLTGHKTLTRDAIDLIKQMGYTVSQEVSEL